jgi:hypothetical protein
MTKHWKLGIAALVAVVAGGFVATTTFAGGAAPHDGKVTVENTKGGALATNDGSVSFQVLGGSVSALGGSVPDAFDLFGKPNLATPGTTITCTTSKQSVAVLNGGTAAHVTVPTLSDVAHAAAKPSFSGCTANGPLWVALNAGNSTTAAVKTINTPGDVAPTTGWTTLYHDGDSGAGEETLGSSAGDTIGVHADNADLTSSVGLPAALTAGATGTTTNSPVTCSPAPALAKNCTILACEVVNSDGGGALPSTSTGAYNDDTGELTFSGSGGDFGVALIQNPADAALATPKICPSTIKLPTNTALGALSGQTIQAKNGVGIVQFSGSYAIVPVIGDR